MIARVPSYALVLSERRAGTGEEGARSSFLPSIIRLDVFLSLSLFGARARTRGKRILTGAHPADYGRFTRVTMEKSCDRRSPL